MGLCYGSQSLETKHKPIINTIVAKHQQPQEIYYKLLLLGAGQSGKSTLFKQIRYIHGQPYGEYELFKVKPLLTQNVIEAMRTLATYSDLLADQNKDTRVSDENEEIRDKTAMMSDKQLFTEQNYNEFKQLWEDVGIKKTLEYRHQFQLIDNVEYLFNHMHLYWRDDYVPTFEDLKHSYKRSNGTNKIQFAIKDNIRNLQEIYEIFDCGGQKNQRRKWIHFFDNTDAIIFVAALSEYNQLLWEDHRSNRLKESIGLFRGIVNMPVFQKSHVILFLNKFDLFKLKIGKHKIKEYFHDYDGDDTEDDGILFFKKKFYDQRRGQAINKSIYVHITCATNRRCIKKMFADVCDIVISKEISKTLL